MRNKTNNKKYLNIFTAALFSAMLLLFGGNIFAQSYTFNFPNYSTWETTIVSWGDTYHYNKGGRSWNEMTVNLPQGGTYDVYTYFHANSGKEQLHEEYKILVDGNYVGQTVDPNIGDDYKEEKIGTINLSEGNHLVRAEHLWNYSDWDSPESVDAMNVTFVLKNALKPNFDISKSVDKSEANPKDYLNYTISYHNTGQAKATNVVISDDYDENYLTIIDTGNGNVSNGKITWNIGEVKAMEGGVLTFKAKIKEDAQKGTVQNSATINCDEIAAIESNNVYTDINVPQTNNPPTANAGPDKTIYENESTTLNGSGSDPDGDPITYRWSCTGGNLSSFSLAEPLFTAPSVGSDTSYTCTLTVTDDKGLSDSDSMVVNVRNKQQTNAFGIELEKTVRNLSNKDNQWYKSVNAKPFDLLEFKIRVKAVGNVGLEDMMVRDILPDKLIYLGNLKINGVSLPNRDISQKAINVGEIMPGSEKIITFLAKVAAKNNFGYGSTDLVNTAMAFNDLKSDSTTCRIVVYRKEIAGASTINTGITTTLLDTILLPLMIALSIVWFFKSKFIGLDAIIEKRRNKVIRQKAKRKLNKIRKKI